MKFCEKLIILRKRRGLTQQEFAREIGVSRQSVYKWESGRSYPEASKLMEIRRLYGISVDELLDENEALLLAEEKKTERSTPLVPPAPVSAVYGEEPTSESEAEPAPATAEEPTPTPVEVSKPTQAEEKNKSEMPREAQRSSFQQARAPRVSIATVKKKKQNPFLELVGTIFGKKR